MGAPRKPSLVAVVAAAADENACSVCRKKVYLVEKVECNGIKYHKGCVTSRPQDSVFTERQLLQMHALQSVVERPQQRDD